MTSSLTKSHSGQVMLEVLLEVLLGFVMTG
jgi:hypothetical protein